MAPKAGPGKRQSSAPSKGSLPPGKKRRPPAEDNDPVGGLCASICMAIEDAELPKSARLMLSNMVSPSLGVLRTDRVPFQESVVEMLGQTLAEILARYQRLLEEARLKVDGADGERAAREAAVEEAERSLATLAGAVEDGTAAHEVDLAAHKAATVTCSRTEADQRRGEFQLAYAQSKKEVAETALSQHYESLVSEGASSASTRKKSAKALQEVGAQFCLDRTMLDAVAVCTVKEPSARCEFDNLVLGRVKEEFEKAVQLLAKALEEGAAAQAACAPQAEAASAAVTEALAKCDASKAAVFDARAAQKEAEKGLQAAKKKVSLFLADMRILGDALDEAKCKVSSMQEGAMAAFEKLRNRAESVLEIADD